MNLTVDRKKQYQTFEGFGASMNLDDIFQMFGDVFGGRGFSGFGGGFGGAGGMSFDDIFDMFGGFGELFQTSVASILSVMITLVLVNMFDTLGTLIGAADKAGYLDENGNMPKLERAMLADAVATSAGAVIGTSTVTTYVESTAGISVGGRTSLTSIVTGACFALSIFLSPILGFVPAAATAPVLIVVGVMMSSALKDVCWQDLEEAIPAFMTVICMPLFYSITEGIAFGFISYVVVKLAKGKIKEIKPVMYVIIALFIVKYVIGALG